MAKGKPCPHAALGVVWRYQPGGACIQCARTRANAIDPAVKRERGRRTKTVRTNRWREKHPEKFRILARRLNWKAQGIVFWPGQTFDSLLSDQNGLCRICGCDLLMLSTRQVHVDHDHSVTDGSPNVRGILCQKHNTLLGFLEGEPGIAERAETYLSAFRAKLARKHPPENPVD